jgi:hypothetical protein
MRGMLVHPLDGAGGHGSRRGPNESQGFTEENEKWRARSWMQLTNILKMIKFLKEFKGIVFLF